MSATSGVTILRRAKTSRRYAVLPFTNLSDDPGQDYFADGIAEDLATDMSQLSGLVVISRHSSFLYKRSVKPAATIADELGARYLVEGSVRRADDRVRIAASLIDAASRAQIWAERYDRDLKDIFAVQDDVARRIVKSLRIKLVGTESDRLGHEGTSRADAFDQLLRGLERLWRYERKSAEEAMQYFTEALQIDPDYAAAHAWLARAYVFAWAMHWADDAVLDVAFRHAQIAVALDHDLPLAQAVFGWAHLWRREGDEALEAGRHAVALDPNNADARLFLSITLNALGRAKEGLEYIRSAIRLNPHPSALYLMSLGANYLALGQFEAAAEAFAQGIELKPNFPPNHLMLARTLLRIGRNEEAVAAWRSCLALTGGQSVRIFAVAEPLRSEWEDDLAALEQLDRR